MEFDEVLYKELKENICDVYGVRYDEDKDKKEFRKYIEKIASKYSVSYDETNYSDEQNINIIIGDIDNAKVILCAHYDTPKNDHEENFIKQLLGRTIPSKVNYNDNSSGVISTLLHINNKKIAIVLFDNEEIGMKGSKAFSKLLNINYDKQLIINFDCVGDGNYLILYVNKLSKKERIFIDNIFTEDNVILFNKFLILPADTLRLRKYKTIGLSRSNSKRWLPKLEKIHTTNTDDFIRDDLIKDLYLKISQIIDKFN